MSVEGEQTPSDQVVLITGASGGIGKETALAFARRRARLALASRSPDALELVANECRLVGAAEVLIRVIDIGDAEQVRDLFDATLARFDRVDVAVQCAAISAFGRFEDVPVEVFDAVLTTNLLGAANVARAAMTFFQARGVGHLVVVGSLLGVTAVPYQSAYVISKFAVNGLVRVLRQENRHLPGIRVHGIYPGPVDTPLYGIAANYQGHEARVLPTADPPAAIAAAIVAATERDKCRERQVGWVNRPLIVAYRVLPRLFDVLVGPMVRTGSFSTRHQEPTTGNAFGPPPTDLTSAFTDGAARPTV